MYISLLQDSGQDITSRVFQGCGRPTLRRAKRNVSPKLLLAPSAVAVQELHVASPVEADTLDIDAALDEAIVLRERRAADPGSQETTQSQEQGTGDGNGGGRGGGGNNRRQQQQRRKQQQQQRRKKQEQNNRNDNDDDDGDNGNGNGGGGGGGGGGNNREPILDKIVRDIRQRVKDYKKFWSNLPHSICSNEDIAASSDVDGMCWNGHTIDR